MSVTTALPPPFPPAPGASTRCTRPSASPSSTWPSRPSAAASRTTTSPSPPPTHEEPRLVGSVKVDSLKVKDPNLAAHLTSAEFFDAERYPELRFESTALPA